MTIAQEVFQAFLQCPTKAYLIAHSVTDGASFSKPHLLEDAYRHEGTKRLLREFHAEQTTSGVVISNNKGNGDHSPVLFTLTEKLSNNDKLMLAFDALALSGITGNVPRAGEIIHGRDYRTTRVPLAKIYPKVRSALQIIEQQATSLSPPPLVLNRHCPNCRYVTRCRQIAKESDDLSLLAKMSDKERDHYHRKGIFTVTQLSHTFRPRRRGRSTHEHALRALAIRKNQIHIVGKLEWNAAGTLVYIDVEGDPDRDFYYCIGIRFTSDSVVERSFWADTPADEARMWDECLRFLTTIENATLIHFGAYEATFLRQMKKRHPEADSSGSLDRLISSAINLVAAIYGRIYFPTYSNGLKDIATYLGFCWSETSPTGLKALLWRRDWELSRDHELKQRLLTYNAEDCTAAQVVAHALSGLAGGASQTASSVVDVTSLRRDYPRRFGEVDFALPEFQQINEAAQWDYQRERVHLRFAARKKRRQDAARSRTYQLDRTIEVEEERPAYCATCGSKRITLFGHNRRVIHDLKISHAGIRRWIVKYRFPRYICAKCRKTMQRITRSIGKYGPTLCSHVAYQLIELRLSQHSVARDLLQTFNLSLVSNTVNRLKAKMAQRYEAVYQRLVDKIAQGALVHADETRARIIGKDVYVWAFTNLEEVAFVVSESREASTAQEFLADFKGVLVTDFYTGYDSIDCMQQRCLIHLMRDINDDLRKHPFNEEMKAIARRFADLLRPIIETVDRYGLKTRHLHKHTAAVGHFFREMLDCPYKTEVATGYQRRFEKNRERLFTFINYDGVPWNNNNAEHAIKAFARMRNVIGGTSTLKGLREYLMLLSISETCKFKSVRFLDFLLSQEPDIDQFRNRPGRRRIVPSYDYLKGQF